MSPTSMLSPTRLGFDGSTKVQMSLATEPNTSARFGDDSQCATSSTSCVAINFGIRTPASGTTRCGPGCGRYSARVRSVPGGTAYRREPTDTDQVRLVRRVGQVALATAAGQVPAQDRSRPASDTRASP